MTFSQKVTAFSAAVEGATGLALIAAPVLVGQLLLGAELPSKGIVVARCFGIALLALTVAVWPGGDNGGRSGARAMFLYNALIALYLMWLGVHWHMGGMLLWPAVALHAVVAVLLGWALTAAKAR